MQLKKCCKCLNEYPKTNKHFYFVDKNKKYFSYVCKECHKKRVRPNIDSYNIRNKEAILARRRVRDRNRSFKKTIENRMGVAIYYALKGNKKNRKWENLVGYTLQDLKDHIEKMFSDGMSWENIGEWHIDHIIPKSAFNYTEPEHIDFKRCWSLSNLQPLWAKENMSKRCKLKKQFQPSLQI